MTHSPDRWHIWLAFFGYSLVMALSIQFVVLPHMMSHLHWGQGLMNGWDSITFHRLSVELADRILTEGWSVWSLYADVEGGAIVGVTSALYALTFQEPWTLIPINALAHSSAAFLIVCIIEKIVNDRRIAMWSALPFLVYPSALSWYSQVHPEGWFILGNLLFLFGWIHLIQHMTKKINWLSQLLCTGSILIGVFLAWITREQSAFLMQAFSGMFATALTVFALVKILQVRSRTVMFKMAYMIMVSWVITGAVTMLLTVNDRTMTWIPGSAAWNARNNPPRGAITTTAPEATAPEATAPEAIAPAVTADATQRVAENLGLIELPTTTRRDTGIVASIPYNFVRGGDGWRVTPWIPEAVDRRIRGLAQARASFRRSYRGAGLNLDDDIGFSSISDMLRYVPRATVVSLFAPFPEHWSGFGMKQGGTTMRRITGFEMLFVYLCLAILPYAIWRWRKRFEIYLITIYCFISIMLFTMGITNLGALYRFRYGFLMTLIAVSLSSGLAVILRKPTADSVSS